MRSRSRIRARWGILSALLGVTGAATAAEPEGFDLQTLSLAPAGDRLHLAEDGSASGDGTFAARLLGSYAYKPLLRRSGAGEGGEDEEIVSSQLHMNLGVSYAISRRWLLALDVPWVLAQSGVAAVEGAHLSDVRLAARATVLRSTPFSLGAEVAAFLPTGSPAALTGDDSVRAKLLVAGSGRAGSFVYAANVGYLARTQRDLAGASVGPALPFAAGGGLLLLEDALTVSAELSGFTGLKGGNGTPLFGLLAARYRIGSVVLGGGVGPGLSSAPGVAPRVLFSAAWEPEAQPPAETRPAETPPAEASPAEASPAEASPAEASPAETPLPAAAQPPAPTPPEVPAAPPPPAQVTPPPPPPPPPPPALSDEEARAEARRLFAAGVAAFDENRFADAADAFGKAMALKPHPTVLRNLAQSELMAGRKEAACAHFKQWKSQVESPSPAELSQVNQGMKQSCR